MSIMGGKRQVNRPQQKVRSFLVKAEPLALSFDPRPCGEITTAAAMLPDRPDIAVYGSHHAASALLYTLEP
jgi:hypothetical protein